MKKLKWYAKIGIIFGAIFGTVLAFCAGVIINGTCFRIYKKDTSTEVNWMEKLPDNELLTDVKIPGSHDACTYKMLWLGACQNLTIEQQLEVGVRYFDIRVKNNDDKYIIYHGPINGVEFDPIVDSIASFLENHTSETLILDFQHFENNAQDYVFEKVTEKLLPYAITNDKNISDQQFVSELKVGDARGKCLILFGYGAYENEPYIFRRNNDECTNEGCSLDSFYYTERNIDKSTTYIEKHIPSYISQIKEKHAKEQFKSLSVLQCQLTDGKLIFGPYSREKTHDKKMSAYIRGLKANEDFNEINIIMRDFMNAEKAQDIYNLNF